ncbi:vacuolar protein sorting/targeting protein PEP1 [Vermiconidia calcicola]|uniref:Vacuolar protein sorting/targeting protein PEP1 n=1 Tax=Vermiconidia calcicola TaxID=1690605 RepID=A0ACC3NST3_9PEZI|nr:vacuolar protein sorting/targeting protein PEP1 [Vermiconidia calcicola]
MHRGVALLAYLLLSLSLGVLGKDEPKVEKTAFNDIPTNLFYFEDSDVVLVTDPSARTTYRSEDAGFIWKRLDGVAEGEVLEVLKHPYDNEVAVVLGMKKRHWITRDQGKSWKKFTLDKTPTVTRPAISFHASDPERMMFFASDCQGILDCRDSVYYTTDGFESDPKLLKDGAISCLWAKSTDLFTTGDDKTDKKKVICIVEGSFDPFSNNYRLVSSDDFFETEDTPSMGEGNSPSGFMRLAAVKSYIVAAAKSEGTTELAMYVTNNTHTWHRAEFGEHKLEEDAYTVLESTNYSMQVDVLVTKPTSPSQMGVLLTSNSNGTFFTKNIEHTNRGPRGYVDFEKIQNIQGIVLVNTVDNWKEVEDSWFTEKKLKTQISFDDGRTWQPLKVDDDDLHLHSVTDQRNVGRVFSSPAPGIVMGVGNTGSYLRDRSEGDVFVSDDAGLTWIKTLSTPHLYEFGDQGSILVAVEDGKTDEVKYSLNHGKDWEDFDLPVEGDIAPIALTTVPDSTSRKFILTASKGGGSDIKHFIFAINFEELDIRKCKDKDFEDWYARVDDEGEPTCIMGHTQKFRRRKRDAECLVDDDKFHEAIPISEDCKCKDEDFECDYENGFTSHDGDCRLTGQMKQPEGVCDGDKKNFKGPSGYRLIPGNTCVRKGGVAKDEPVDRECKDLKKPVASGKVATEITKFRGERFVEYYYLERAESASGDDETVIMRTDRREAYLTHDHGKTWEQIVKDEEVVAIYPHQYLNDNVYIITPSKTVYYSKTRGKKISSFEAPDVPNQEHIQILAFHPQEDDWLIWIGNRDSDHQTTAHVSTHGGDKWDPLLRSVRKCQFVYREGRPGSEKLVYCEQYDNEDDEAPIQLLSSDDWFDTKKTLKRDVINFATMAEYIVVAVRDAEQKTLQVDTSIDGQVFADAKFPSNFQVPHQQAYTVLDSSTHAVFLHVSVNTFKNQEYGSILKSNSNGTSYVHAVSGVNRDTRGYVDFEKMQGLEGVAVINRVSNVDAVDGGSSKKLKTYITHNDGADWNLIPRPEKALKGVPFDCNGAIAKCSLHLHGYTERKDPRDQFSSPSAVGLMMATGNVGDSLGYRTDADTFITRDGGLTWEVVAPGNWMWEYGDQGSVLVIVKEDVPYTSILYSLDEGREWIEYEFSDREMLVEDITTVPSDTSLNFLLWGKIDGDLVTVNLDFSGLEERSVACNLDEKNPTGKQSDYRLWSPKHPNSDDDCLFGHISQYHRKKTDRKCYNGGRTEIQHLHNVVQNCTCTRNDFECDYNYERKSDGHCELVAGLKAINPKSQCDKKGVKEYSEVTGYRRIPISTCSGGKEFDKTDTHPCPGFEDWHAKKHGMGGVGLFFAIVLPIAAAAGIGYWVYMNWDDKFGRIRLGDGTSPLAASTGYTAFDRDAPWIKYPVMAVSGVVAVLAAVPMVIGSIWSLVSTRLGRSTGGHSRPYTSRSSFARGRGDYSVVADEDGELLGEDSDEDI